MDFYADLWNINPTWVLQELLGKEIKSAKKSSKNEQMQHNRVYCNEGECIADICRRRWLKDVEIQILGLS